MGHGIDRHTPAHHIHGSLADKTAGKHHGVHTASLYLPGYGKTVVDLKTTLESVAHVGLHQYPHIRPC